MDQEFIDACKKLNLLYEESKGESIELENGEKYKFKKIAGYTEDDLITIEEKFNFQWPTTFKYFLQQVGVGECYMDEYNLGIEFIPLDVIYNNQSNIFENPKDNPFPNLIVVCLLSGRGDFGGFYFGCKSKTQNFAIFSGEEPPKEWISQDQTFVSFSQWIIKLVSSHGENDMPPY